MDRAIESIILFILFLTGLLFLAIANHVGSLLGIIFCDINLGITSFWIVEHYLEARN